jgi:hypothetical protein
VEQRELVGGYADRGRSPREDVAYEEYQNNAEHHVHSSMNARSVVNEVCCD